MSAKDIQFKKLRARITREMKRLRVPGVAAGVWHSGKEYSAGFGVTSAENPLPVTADTLFQIGSITKTFTGTMLMQLAERGRIELDAPVKTYLKDLKLRDKKIEKRATSRHLLTHLGGWVGEQGHVRIEDEGEFRLVPQRVHLGDVGDVKAARL